MNIPIAIPIFGRNIAQTHALITWIKFFRKTESEMEVVLITDSQSAARFKDIVAKHHMREIKRIFAYDDEEMNVFHHPLQKADWLKANAHRDIGPCILIDTDVIFMKPPERLLNFFPVDVEIAASIDVGNRNHYLLKQRVPEINFGVVYWNSAHATKLFNAHWHDPNLAITKRKHVTFGQIVLGDIKRQTNFKLLPMVCNWSYWELDKMGDELPINLHFHGRVGKIKLKEMENDLYSKVERIAS